MPALFLNKTFAGAAFQEALFTGGSTAAPPAQFAAAGIPVEFDFEGLTFGQVQTAPDWVFTDLARQPADIVDESYVGAGPSVLRSIRGSVGTARASPYVLAAQGHNLGAPVSGGAGGGGGVVFDLGRDDPGLPNNAPDWTYNDAPNALVIEVAGLGATYASGAIQIQGAVGKSARR